MFEVDLTACSGQKDYTFSIKLQGNILSIVPKLHLGKCFRKLMMNYWLPKDAKFYRDI